MAFSIGSVTAKLEAKTKEFTQAFSNAGKSLDKFGSKGKRLEDRLKDLERRKSTVIDRMNELKRAGKEGSNSYRSLSDRLAKYNDTLDTHKMKMSEFASAQRKAGQSLGLLGRSFTNLSKVGQNAMKGLFDSVKRVAEIALGNILATAIINVTGQLKNLAQTAIFSAGETEKQAVAFEVLTGSAENAANIMQGINDLAVKTPFEIDQLRTITKQMLAFGFNQKDILTDLEMLGDITAGTGGDLMLLGRAYGQVKTKGKLFAQELNQLGEQGLAVREILAKDLGISVEELMLGMEKKNITVPFEQLQRVMQRLHKEKFMGLMAKQADTMSGRFDNLKEQANLTTQEILGMDTATGEIQAGSMLDKLTNKLSQALSFLEKNKEAIISFGQTAFDVFFKVSDFVAKNLGKAFVALSNTVKENEQNIRNAFETMKTTFFTGVAVIKQVLTDLKPTFIAVFTALKTVGMDLYQNLFVPLGIFLQNTLAPAFGFLYSEIISKLVPAVMNLGQSLMSLWNIISPVVLPVIKFLAIGLGVVLYGAVLLVINIFSALATAVSWVIKGIVAGFNLLKSGWDLLVMAFEIGKNLMIQRITTIKNAFDDFKNIDLFQIGKDIVTGLINGIGSMAGELKNKVGDMANSVKNGFKNALQIKSPSRVMKELGVFTAEGVAVGIEKGVPMVETASTEMAESTVKPVSNVVNNNVSQNNSFNINNNNPFAVSKLIRKDLARQNDLANAGLNLAT